MKIAVINYSELNNIPTENQVLEDILNVYKKSDKIVIENIGSNLRNQIEKLINNNDSVNISYMDTSDNNHRNRLEAFVRDESPDLLVSYNLAGFELCTLTDSLLYNLIDCRQFHFIKKRNLPNEKYLQKLKSINLFMFEDYSERG